MSSKENGFCTFVHVLGESEERCRNKSHLCFPARPFQSLLFQSACFICVHFCFFRVCSLDLCTADLNLNPAYFCHGHNINKQTL